MIKMMKMLSEIEKIADRPDGVSLRSRPGEGQNCFFECFFLKKTSFSPGGWTGLFSGADSLIS
jgi:hypothetical protein